MPRWFAPQILTSRAELLHRCTQLVCFSWICPELQSCGFVSISAENWDEQHDNEHSQRQLESSTRCRWSNQICWRCRGANFPWTRCHVIQKSLSSLNPREHASLPRDHSFITWLKYFQILTSPPYVTNRDKFEKKKKNVLPPPQKFFFKNTPQNFKNFF